jgi:hypothetical protein
MNYIILDGVKYRLVPEEATNCKEEGAKLCLGDIRDGEVCKIGEWEFIVCEHTREGTVLLMKDCLYDAVEFGDNNNYNGSNVDKLCEEFADKLAEVVGEENIIRHTVDLTADDGLRDYGSIERCVSLFTANQYRKYCDILDKYRLNIWTWTATAYSTPKHDDDCWVKCVAPRGVIGDYGYGNDYGVRPFCILKSNIFVSK